MQNVNNVTLIRKEACCGCSACASCCPVGAIGMRADFEGYLYPQIDPERCITAGSAFAPAAVYRSIRLRKPFMPADRGIRGFGHAVRRAALSPHWPGK